MMSVLSDLDAKIADVVHKVIEEVVVHEPTIDVALMTTLRDLDAPPEVSDAVQGLVRSLLSHFTAEQAKAAAAAAAAEEAEGAPGGQG